MILQRTAITPLTPCLTPRVHFRGKGVRRKRPRPGVRSRQLRGTGAGAPQFLNGAQKTLTVNRFYNVLARTSFKYVRENMTSYCAGAIAFAMTAISLFAGQEKLRLNVNIPLWPEGKVPDAVGTLPIDKPYLTASFPPDGKANGTAVIIGPGGGNSDLFAHQEGMDVAEKLNSWGVTAFVLTYRLNPRYPRQETRTLDGSRAVQLLRARAAEFHLDPNRIGMMGFSAGSNLIRPVASSPSPGDPKAGDPVDRVSSRPDFAIMVYGAGRAAPGESLQNYPPVFLIAAAGDSTAPGSAQFFIDLRKAGVNAELHLYQKGRHGFGLGEGHPVLSDWVGRCENWMKNLGLLDQKPETAK